MVRVRRGYEMTPASHVNYSYCSSSVWLSTIFRFHPNHHPCYIFSSSPALRPGCEQSQFPPVEGKCVNLNNSLVWGRRWLSDLANLGWCIGSLCKYKCEHQYLLFLFITSYSLVSYMKLILVKKETGETPIPNYAIFLVYEG